MTITTAPGTDPANAGRIIHKHATTYAKLMNTLAKTCAYLSISLTVGCSSLKSTPETAECAVPTICPACPSVESLMQQCPEPQVVEKIVTITPPTPIPHKPTTAGEMNLPIVGAVEWVNVEPGDLRLLARIDTGSASTSLQAKDIELVEKDGKRWVHFTVLDPATDEAVKIEQRLRRKRVSKNSDGEEQARYTVKMWLTLGKARSQVEVNLTERNSMEYPLLIGRNMLVDNVVVDVSRTQKVSK